MRSVRTTFFGLVAASMIACARSVAPESPGDATVAPADAPSPCTLDRGYTFRWEEGDYITTEISVQLIAPATCSLCYVDEGRACSNWCATQIPGCGSTAGVDLSAVRAALADPDVARAFDADTGDGGTGGTLYGIAECCADSPMSITRDDGRRFSVGDACPDGGACLAVPPGVAILARTLRALERQQIAPTTCARP